MAENRFSRIFKPRGKGKTWWGFIAILVLTVVAGLIVFGNYYNQAVDAHKLPLAKVKEVPFRLGLDLLGGSQLTYDADVSGVASGEQAAAVEGARDVIERRVNVFGVSEPLVQVNRASDGKYRIIVELAGIKDIGEAIKKIGETPLLEFKEQATEARKLTDAEKKQMNDFNAKAKKRSETVLGKIKAGEDFATVAKNYSDDPLTRETGGDVGWISAKDNVEVAKIVEKVETGKTTPTATLTTEGYEIFKVKETRTIDGNKEYNLSHILVATQTEEDILGPDTQWKNTELTGKNLKRASVQFNPQDNTPEVNLEFDDQGAKMFEDITGRNVGKPVAIFLDGYAISTPNVNEKITGGKAVITGNFTVTESRDLAKRLNAGALPVPITLVNQQTVGASLGQQSVDNSLRAGFIGLALVALFMIIYYRFLGLLSVLALAVYGILSLAIFKLWPVTLTLSGIAGFILSIGMAVDANILIFERLKEELRAGKSLSSAIQDGFSRAWPSIRDSNFTTIIVCLVLIQFSTSVIKGFAVTLLLGVLVSMFSAITITRTLLRLFSEKWFEKHRWLIGYKQK